LDLKNSEKKVFYYYIVQLTKETGMSTWLVSWRKQEASPFSKKENGKLKNFIMRLVFITETIGDGSKN